MFLKEAFFRQPTVSVAVQLLGAYFFVQSGRKVCGSKIVETEAYCPGDMASHGSAKSGLRAVAMLGHPGTAYVYLIYGRYCLFNVVTEPQGVSAAVLIRGAEAIDQNPLRLDGPGRFAQNMGLSLKDNGKTVFGPRFWFEKKEKPLEIWCSPRVGITKNTTVPWRFFISPFSKGLSQVKENRLAILWKKDFIPHY